GLVEVPPGAVAFAAVDLDRPDETIPVRGADTQEDTEEDTREDAAARALLTRLAERAGLRTDAAGGRAAAGPGERTVRLFPVHRDASFYSPVPPGTWLLV